MMNTRLDIAGGYTIIIDDLCSVTFRHTVPDFPYERFCEYLKHQMYYSFGHSVFEGFEFEVSSPQTYIIGVRGQHLHKKQVFYWEGARFDLGELFMRMFDDIHNSEKLLREELP